MVIVNGFRHVSAPTSLFDWDSLTPQSPTLYGDCGGGSVTVQNKSFTNFNTGVINGSDVRLTGNCDVTFIGCYFGPSIRKGAEVENFTGTVKFQDCLFVSNECGVEGADSSGDIQFDNCEFLNPWGQAHCKGQAVQLAFCSGAGSYITNCRMENFRGEGSTEDWISMFSTNGNAGSYIRIANNHARGGGPSNSGGGFIGGDGNGSYLLFEDNKLMNPGNYILAAAGGDHIIIRNNMGYQEDNSIQNIAMYAYITNASDHCDTITMTGNSMFLENSDNYYWWGDPGQSCGNVVGVDENAVDGGGQPYPSGGWRQTNNSNLTLGTLNFPTTMITFVDQDRLWHLRQESVQFQSEWTNGGCYDGDPLFARPVSNAGSNQTIGVANATLNGTGSTGNSITYKWVQVSGPNNATITNSVAATTTVTGMVTGVYEFRLVVTDNAGAAAADWMLITATVGNTYYVSNTGNNANAGTSTGAPWQTISKVNSTSFTEGASILFKRGGMWREQLTIPSSGTAVNPITFGAYDTGARPIINGANVTTGWTNAGSNRWWVNCPNVDTNRAMVIIGGIVFLEVASIAEIISPSQYFIDTSASPDRLYVYSTVDPATLTAEVSNRNYGIVTAAGVNSKRYIIIQDIEVRFAGRAGIYFEGPGANFTGDDLDGSSIVRRCTVYANRLYGAVHIDHYNNVLFEDCDGSFNGNGYYSWQAHGGTFRRITTSDHIHYEGTSGFTDGGAVQGYQSDNWLAEYCVSNRDFDAIHLDCGGMPCHGIMRYNQVYDSRAGNPNTPSMGAGSLGVGGRIDIYYNLLVNGASAAMESYSTMNDQVYFYNNTCYQSVTTGTDSIMGNYQSGLNWNIKNNIFVREYVSGEYNMINNGALPTTLDNNLYFIYNNVSGTLRNWYLSARTTLATWKSATGKDTNALSVDPLFVNKTSDWSLQSGSPCRNTGVNVGLTQDILGNPIVGNPDMGCYEYQ